MAYAKVDPLQVSPTPNMDMACDEHAAGKGEWETELPLGEQKNSPDIEMRVQCLSKTPEAEYNMHPSDGQTKYRESNVCRNAAEATIKKK